MTDGLAPAPCRRRLAALALVVIGFLWSLPSLDHAPVLDDASLLRQDDVSAGELFGRGLFSGARGYGGYYRPLTALTFRLETELGLPLSVRHAINGLLHGLTSGAAYLLLLRLLGGGTVPFAAAALFAVHPVHVDAVDPVTGRGDLLAALFLLVAWRAFHAIDGRPLAQGLLCAGAFLAALLSKESAAVLPALLLAGEWVLHRATAPTGGFIGGRPEGFPRGLRWVAVLTVLLGYMVVRTAVLGGLTEEGLPDPLDNPLADAGVAERLFQAPVAWAEGAGLLIWPARLSPDYSAGALVSGVGIDLRSLAGWLLALGALGAWLVAAARPAGAFLGLSILLVGLIPTANLLFAAPVLLAGRILYLPALGATLLLAAGMGGLPARARLPVLMVVAMGWCGLSLALHRHYADDLAVWSRTVAVVPQNGKAWYNLGNAQRRGGQQEQALESYERATWAQPDLGLAWANLGMARARAGQEARARQDLETAVHLDPTLAQAHAALGSLAARRGDTEAAIRHLRTALSLDPRGPEAAAIRALLERL